MKMNEDELAAYAEARELSGEYIKKFGHPEPGDIAFMCYDIHELNRLSRLAIETGDESVWYQSVKPLPPDVAI